MSLVSLERKGVLRRESPDVVYMDPSGYGFVALDAFPAPASSLHLIVGIRTPDAALSEKPIMWHKLPKTILAAANALTDLTLGHMYDSWPARDWRLVRSGKNVVEPHQHILDADTVFDRTRYNSRLSPEDMARLSISVGFAAVAAEADSLFANVDFSELGMHLYAD
jgi:hypothetical protein